MGSEDHDRERVRDIVERLTAEDILTSIISSVWCKTGRHPGELADLMKEAAEEITRLRAEHKMAFEAVGDVVKANDDLRAENEKLRNEVMSDYHEGWEEGVKAERERCARVAEQARDDTCDGPVAWSMADSIAAAIRGEK